jgi:hypothetical protein
LGNPDNRFNKMKCLIKVKTLAITNRVILKNNPVFFDLFSLTFFYTLANGLSLFNKGVYWDDWVVYNMDKANIIDMFKQAGAWECAYLHLLVSTGGVTTYRVVVFASYLLAALCFFCVLRELSVARYDRFFIVFFFALFPVNNARMAMINMPVSISYAMFFCGFWVTLLYLKKHNYWYRAIALSLLFVSFRVNSLLVFYLIVILCIMYLDRPVPLSISGWLRLLPHYADYILLPFLFFIVKNLYMKPYGRYAGYNQITLDGVVKTLIDKICVFDTSFFAVIDKVIGYEFFSPLYQSVASINIFLPFTVVMFVIALLFLCKKVFKKVDRESFKTLGCFLLGVFTFWLAAFPYIVVGKIPALGDWASRFQLLVPFGVSFLLVYGFKLLCRHRAFTFPIYFLLGIMFIHAAILDKISFQRDWYKQLSIIENMRNSTLIVNNTSFLFRDDTRADLNFNSRTYRFYEYTGLMKEAFKDERRFGMELQVYNDDNKTIHNLEKFMTSSYNMGDFVFREPDSTVIISRGTTELSAPADVLELMWMERTDNEKFFRLVSDIVKFEVL